MIRERTFVAITAVGVLLLSGCSPEGDVTRSAEGGSQTVVPTKPGTKVIADGPIFDSVNLALEGAGRFTRGNTVVIGRITKKIKTITFNDGHYSLKRALYQLQIEDALGAKLSKTATLYGFDDAPSITHEANPPLPRVGMRGAFVLGVLGDPGKEPFDKAYGVPYGILLYLQSQPDGSFADPERPMQVRSTLAELRAAAARKQ